MVAQLTKLDAATQEEVDGSAGKDRYFSRAVSKALELLSLLEQLDAPSSLNALASAVGLTKSSAFRLLYTLESLNHIRRDDAGNYLRAHSGLKIENAFPRRLLEAAATPMRKLSMEFRETISLSHLLENHIEVLSVIDSPHLIRMANIVGRILPPHASSMGKAITAFQSPETRSRLIHSYGMTCFTPRTIGDEQQLEDSLNQIRISGISYDDEENTQGGFCIGVPIFWPGKEVRAALSLSMPKVRLSQEQNSVEACAASLQEAAKQIAQALG